MGRMFTMIKTIIKSTLKEDNVLSIIVCLPNGPPVNKDLSHGTLFNAIV